MNCLQQVDRNFQKFTTNYFDKIPLKFSLTMFTNQANSSILDQSLYYNQNMKLTYLSCILKCNNFLRPLLEATVRATHFAGSD